MRMHLAVVTRGVRSLAGHHAAVHAAAARCVALSHASLGWTAAKRPSGAVGVCTQSGALVSSH